MDWEQADLIRRELGLDGLAVRFPPEFDRTAFSRNVPGLDDPSNKRDIE